MLSGNSHEATHSKLLRDIKYIKSVRWYIEFKPNYEKIRATPLKNQALNLLPQ